MTRNSATVVVHEGDKGWLIATCSQTDPQTLNYLYAALNNMPGVANVTDTNDPSKVMFTMKDAPPLDELGHELTQWVK